MNEPEDRTLTMQVPAMSWMGDVTPEAQAKVNAIGELMPRLLTTQHTLRTAGFEPTAVLLPADMNPGDYDGQDATDRPATLIGLPIIWADRVGLVLPA